jgi:DNA-binding NarL/FixJ family response regulator
MIRLLLADDHVLVREGLKQILNATSDLHVAAEAGDGNQALAFAKQETFTLALLDMSMPGISGIELIKRLRQLQPTLKILVLSMHAEQQYAARAFKAGAAGYLTKDSAPDQLVQAIRKIAAGGVYVSAHAAEQLALDAMPGHQALAHTLLSDREYQIMRRLIQGDSLTAIGQSLHLSVKTVSTHKTRLLQKMQLSGTADLVRYALTHQLIDESTHEKSPNDHIKPTDPH